MTIYRCDKCGEEYKTSSSLDKVVVHDTTMADQEFDLCCSCKHSLLKWLKDKLPKVTNP